MPAVLKIFNQVEFDQRIRELRRTGGLTQEALSEELNISSDQLRKIECGSRGPSLDLLISLDFLSRMEYNKESVRGG